MRKIIAAEFMTIDGVIQNEVSDGDGFKYGGWFFPYADEVTGAVAQERLAKPIDLLLGRKTFAARDICKGEVPWDAYVYVLDPDALAEEFASQQRRVLESLRNNDDGLRGFEIKDADGYILFFGRPLS